MEYTSIGEGDKLIHEKRFEEAHKIFLRLAHNACSDWRIYDRLANLEVELRKDLEHAKQLIERARELGCPARRYPGCRCNIFLLQNNLLAASGEYEQVFLIEKTISSRVNWAKSLLTVDEKRAEEVWRTVLEKDHSNLDALYWLADLAQRQKRWSEALEMLLQADTQKPNDPEILIQIAVVSLSLDSLDNAKSFFTKAVQAGYKREDGYLALIDYANRRENWDFAQMVGVQARQQNPTNPECAFEAGVAYHGAKNYNKALECYMEASKLGYKNRFFLECNIAECYIEMGNYNKSCEHIMDALSFYAGDSDANSILRYLATKVGAHNSALGEKLLSKIPKNDPKIEGE